MRRTQVAVVGGGPAGLSAAFAAAGAGAKTILLDEQPSAGGQLRYRIAELPAGPFGTIRAHELAIRMIDAAVAAGVQIRGGATVWGVFEGRVLTVVEEERSFQLQAERLILATGSTDRPLPFPGGSLPGVFTGRAIQILLNEHRVLPGRRFVVVGAGSEAAEVALDISLAGAEVVTRVATDPLPAIVAEGKPGVERVWIDGTCIDADAVVLAIGRQPDPALALMAECAAGYADDLGGWTPVRDDRLQTTALGVYACGDVAGTCDVQTALAEGMYAGHCAAASLDLVDTGTLHRARATYEAAAPTRIRLAASLRPTYLQVERITTEV